MHKLYQDGMAIVQVFEKSDLCSSFRSNAQDRLELISHVFNMKLKAIFNDILKENIFGKVLTYLYTIEFQKCGLPHAHVLLILIHPYKSRTVADYNTIVLAKIPDRNNNSDTFNTV